MGIFQAVAFIMVLIAIRVLMPEVWHGIETTLVDLFHSIHTSLATIEHLQSAAAGNYIPNYSSSGQMLP